jgi:hypothetical protein
MFAEIGWGLFLLCGVVLLAVAVEIVWPRRL